METVKSTQKILVPLPPGVEEMEVVAIADVLRRGGLAVVLAGLHGAATPVVASRGVRIMPDVAWPEVCLDDFDALVLPGGAAGVAAMEADRRVLDAARVFVQNGKLIGAICSAPLVLQAAGVLVGRKVTSYPGVADRLRNCQWVDMPVVVDEKLVTGQGAGVAVDFALALLRLLINEAAVGQVMRALCLPLGRFGAG